MENANSAFVLSFDPSRDGPPELRDSRKLSSRALLSRWTIQSRLDFLEKCSRYIARVAFRRFKKGSNGGNSLWFQIFSHPSDSTRGPLARVLKKRVFDRVSACSSRKQSNEIVPWNSISRTIPRSLENNRRSLADAFAKEKGSDRYRESRSDRRDDYAYANATSSRVSRNLGRRPDAGLSDCDPI